MKIIADLHLHSKYSRATSKELDIKNLVKYSKIKGVNLLGTSDFTHPLWLKELKSTLKDDRTGILTTESGFPFILQTELSLIYAQGGKGRRIHQIIYSPDFDTVDQINEYLLKHGRLDYDGRPIFKIPCDELLYELKKINSRIELIPAHVWTPWFGLFGSMSGFDTVEEAFGDQTKHIFALETGLSSDPPMNWRLSSLDKYSLVSNSDSHSFWPWRLGREANVFELPKLTYDSLFNAIKTRKGFMHTVEVDPNYGKYHFDGHRNCGICMDPKETKEKKGICPICKKPLTIGVLNRVEALADREVGFKPKDCVGFKSLIPLSEILSEILNSGVATKKVWETYHTLIKGRTEYDVLLETPIEELTKLSDEKIAQAIIDNRNGNIEIKPGYDGEYGRPVLGTSIISEVKAPQKDLNQFFQ